MIRVDVSFYEKEDESVVTDLGGVIVDPLDFIPTLYIAEIPEDKLEELRANPLVKSVDVEEWMAGNGVIEGNPIDWNPGNSISQTDTDYVPYIYDKLFLQCKEFWDRGITGKGMKVGIIDAAGVNSLYVPVKDGTWVDASVTGITDAFDAHSTSVAGCATGRPVWNYDGSYNRNLSGVAFDADLYVGIAGAHGMGNATNTSYALTCLNWLIGKKVDVVNCSWAGGSYSASFETAVNTATAAGIAVVISAGNDGTATITEQGQFPSNLANAIAIAGCDDKKTRWLDPTNIQGAGTGSQTSASNMFTAPSYRVLTYYYSATATPGTQSVWFTGTSAAAPLMAGYIALYKQALPNKTLPQLLSIMQNNVWAFGKTGRNMEYGYGMPQPSPEILNKPITIDKGLKLEYHTTVIETPINSLLTDLTNTFTIECTFSNTEGSGGYLMRMLDYTALYNVWGLYLDAYSQVFYSYSGTNSAYIYNYDLTTLEKEPQTWHVVYNYPNIYVYRNGKQVQTGTMSGSMVKAANVGNSKIQFGRYIKGAFHGGRVYNRSLSAAEVVQVASGMRISSGLVLEYIPTGNETTQILDTSGNGLHGTLLGGMTPTIKRIN